MGVTTTGPARVAAVFHPPVVPQLTEAALTAAGLPLDPYTAMHVDLVRVTPKGKWHAPGTSTHRCVHVTRGFGYLPVSLPVQQVSVLGEYDVCSACAHQVRVPGPAGVLHVAAGLTVAAAQWVAEFERLAPGMGWLDAARWSRQTPFGPPDPIADLLGGLKSVRGFAAHRTSVAAAWDRLRRRVDTAVAVARQAAGPPGLRVLAARARDLLLSDRTTLDEAHVLEAISGGVRRILYEPQLSRHALDAWLQAVAADGDLTAGHTAMLAAVEARLAGAEVRDVSLLPVPPLTGAAGHASPAAWAAVEYQLLRAHVVDVWCTRLAAALHDVHLPSGVGDQLLLVAGWPIVNEPDREIAYLTQYPVLADAVVAARYRTPIPASQTVPRAVVLRVPAFAAGHAAAHRSDYLHMVPGASVPGGAVVEDRDVRALLRSAAGYLPQDSTADPAGPLPAVAAWRAAAGPATDLRAWATEHGGHHWNLPQRWRWIPAEDPHTNEPGSALLQQLCQALRHATVVLVLAAGEHDALDRVELVVYPDAVDPATGALTYRPYDLPGCPTVTVPWWRIIAVHDAW